MALGGSDATCWIEWIANEKILLHTFCSVKLPWRLHFYPLQSSHVFGMKNEKFDISGAKRFIPTNTLKPWLFSLPKEAPARSRHQRWRAKLQKKTEGWRITQRRHMLYAAYALHRHYIYIYIYILYTAHGCMGEWDCLMGTFIIEYWISNQRIKSLKNPGKVANSDRGSQAARKRRIDAHLRSWAWLGSKAWNRGTRRSNSSIRQYWYLISLYISCIRFKYLYYVYIIYMKETFSLSKVLTCFFHILLSFSCWESSAPFLPHKLISPP